MSIANILVCVCIKDSLRNISGQYQNMAVFSVECFFVFCLWFHFQTSQVEQSSCPQRSRGWVDAGSNKKGHGKGFSPKKQKLPSSNAVDFQKSYTSWWVFFPLVTGLIHRMWLALGFLNHPQQGLIWASLCYWPWLLVICCMGLYSSGAI